MPNAQQIWREVAAQGCRSSRRTVEQFVGNLRRETGTRFKFKAQSPAVLYTQTDVALRQPLTPVHAARLFVARPEQVQPSQREQLTALLALDPLIPLVYDLAQQFCMLVRQRQGQTFDQWLHEVEQVGAAELQSFATSLSKDDAAVRAGVSLPWGNGPRGIFID